MRTRVSNRRALAFSMLTSVATLIATESIAHAEPGDELTISVLTFGPGDHPFFRFGHTALLVEDANHGTALVYNYGTFAFDSLWLVPRFLLGDFRYWLSTQRLSTTIAAYRREQRSIVAQRLRLTAAQKVRLVKHVQSDALEENKYYQYDYYRNNCVTKVRDRIDEVVDGGLSRASSVPGAMTFRQHTARMTAEEPALYFLLYVALSGRTDRHVSAWEEMFLPGKLQEGLSRARIPGPSGLEQLVDGEQVVLEGRPRPIPETPPRTAGRSLIAGSAVAFGFVSCARAAHRGSRTALVVFAVSTALLGAASGLLGSLLIFLWLFTRHEFAYRNENLLQLPPFAWLLILPAIGMTRRSLVRFAWLAAAACLGSSLVGVLLKLLPWFGQDIAPVAALALPIWTGLTFSLYPRTPSSSSILHR